MRKLSANTQIVLGALGGIALGLSFRTLPDSAYAREGTYLCGLIGTLFIDLLKMVLIPLVFCSIAVGVARLREHDTMHRIWRYTLAYILATTTLATVLGLSVANAVEPGFGLHVPLFQESLGHFAAQQLDLREFFTTFVHHLVMNPLAAMAQGEVLATVVFALFLGIAFIVTGEQSQHLFVLMSELLDVVMVIVSWIMCFAPIGILALLAKLTTLQTPALFASLAGFAAMVLGSTLFHGLVVLPLLLFIFTRTRPGTFFRGAREALLTALATSSSSATLPVTLRCSVERLGVRPHVGGFVLPLGATLNMDGTALYEAAAALFVANLSGVNLDLLQQLIVCLTAILASIGAPGIPSAGMVTLVMVLQSVGLPTEAIAILLPIDRLLDAFRTMVNVEGDMIGSLIVQKLTQTTNADSAH